VSELLSAALGYAARGWPVFPLHTPVEGGCSCGKSGCKDIGKHPRTYNGLLAATTNVRAIEEWWTRWPDANVGVRTGAISGLLVLDIDPRQGGDDALHELEQEHGTLPVTASVKTPGGGQHYHFTHPGGEVRGSAGEVGPGIDIRADGGYVLVPPSVGASGCAYEQDEEAQLASAPAWLLRLIREARSRRNGNAPPVGDTIPEGQRNTTLASLAGSMRRRGMGSEEIAAALLVSNRQRCQPPMDTCEVEGIAASVSRYEPAEAKPTTADPGWTHNGAGEIPPYRFTPFSEFAAFPFPDAKPLLGERGTIYLAVGSLLLVYGCDGSGKSTWTIDAAAHLGAGRDWLGIPVPRPVRCLLIENEGPGGLFQAKLMAKAESWPGEEFRPNVDVFTAPWGKFSFALEPARQALTTYCDEHEIDVVMANPTLGLGVAASGRPDETQQFVDWLKECGLGSRRAFWLLHHENKAGQISGDWGRHPDTKVLLQPDGNRQRTKLTWEKTRWATLAQERKAVMLDWEIDTEGYTVTPLDTVGASDALLVERLVGFLNDHPFTATRRVLEAVEGTDSRLKELLEGRPEFDYAPGKHGAKLWTVAGGVSQ
jgi:hypothetical protein